MNKSSRPGPQDSWLKHPSAVFDEHLVEEVPIPAAQPEQSTVVTWATVQQAQQAVQRQAVRNTEPIPYGALDRFLRNVCGCEPVSTLIMVCIGCLVAVAQTDPTDWHGWLHGFALALAGRLMNERHP